MLALAAAGTAVLLGLIVVSSGVSLSFITEGERTLLPGLGGATVEGARLGAVLGAFLVAVAVGRTRLTELREISLYIAFLVIATISVAWSPDKGSGLRLLSRLAYPVVAFAACYSVVKVDGDRLFRKACCWAAGIATVVNAFVAVKEMSKSGGAGLGFRYYGSSGPMDFGLFCAAAGLTLYAIWSHYRQPVYLSLAILLGIQLVATGTRTSLIAGAAGFLVFESFHGRRFRAAIGLLLAITVWILVPALGERTTLGSAGTEWITGPGGAHVNLSGRTVLWDDVWNELIGEPQLIGHGLGATQRFMMSRYVLPHDVHNAYLLILADTGILGLTAFLGFLAVVGVRLMCMRRGPNAGQDYPALCFGLLVMVALSGLVQNPLYVYGAAPMFLFTTFALSLGSGIGDRSARAE